MTKEFSYNLGLRESKQKNSFYARVQQMVVCKINNQKLKICWIGYTISFENWAPHHNANLEINGRNNVLTGLGYYRKP